ncbi:MAG: hypothetical protein M0T77_01075 [Actinomycetota bacterium]|nr:hypothetical protein [Actinomycetota bacterium]
MDRMELDRHIREDLGVTAVTLAKGWQDATAEVIVAALDVAFSDEGGSGVTVEQMEDYLQRHHLLHYLAQS